MNFVRKIIAKTKKAAKNFNIGEKYRRGRWCGKWFSYFFFIFLNMKRKIFSWTNLSNMWTRSTHNFVYSKRIHVRFSYYWFHSEYFSEYLNSFPHSILTVFVWKRFFVSSWRRLKVINTFFMIWLDSKRNSISRRSNK